MARYILIDTEKFNSPMGSYFKELWSVLETHKCVLSEEETLAKFKEITKKAFNNARSQYSNHGGTIDEYENFDDWFSKNKETL